MRNSHPAAPPVNQNYSLWSVIHIIGGAPKSIDLMSPNMLYMPDFKGKAF